MNDDEEQAEIVVDHGRLPPVDHHDNDTRTNFAINGSGNLVLACFYGHLCPDEPEEQET